MILQENNPEFRSNGAKIAGSVKCNVKGANFSSRDGEWISCAIKYNFGEDPGLRLEVKDMDSLFICEKAVLTRPLSFFLRGNWRWWILALPSRSTAEARGEVAVALGTATLMGLPPRINFLATYEPCSSPEKDQRL